MRSARSTVDPNARIRRLIPKTKVVRAVIAAAQESGIRTCLVGGPLRDLLLGHELVDVDIAVEGDVRAFGEELKRRLDGKLVVYGDFDTASLQFKDDRHVDIARTRTETYERPAKLPIVFASDTESDLKRRDFTINAMAWDLLDKRLIDPFDGYVDLQRHVIRVLHERSFDDDPTRIFRAVRFSRRLGFSIAAPTSQLMKSAIAAGRLRLLSGERILNELRLIAAEERSSEMLSELNRLGVFEALFGRGLPGPVLSRLGRCGKDRSCLPYLLAQFDHLDGLPLTRELLADVASIKGFPAVRPALLAARRPSEVYRILKPLTRDALGIIAVTETRSVGVRVANYLDRYAAVEPKLRGDDLRRMGIQPGPIYTTILARLRAALLDGAITTRREEKALVTRIRDRARRHHAF